MSWYVVRSKLRQELKARSYFSEQGFEAYVPSRIKRIELQGKIKQREVPVIGGYVFVALPRFNYAIVNDNPMVTDVIKRSGKVVEVSEDEISVMKKHLDPVYQAEDFSDKGIGDIIAIDHGPFSGNQGEVVSRSKNKIILNLASISMRLSIALN